MPTGPFTISVDYLHGTLNGCIRVAATLPSITIYRIPHDFASNLSTEDSLSPLLRRREERKGKFSRDGLTDAREMSANDFTSAGWERIL